MFVVKVFSHNLHVMIPNIKMISSLRRKLYSFEFVQKFEHAKQNNRVIQIVKIVI